MDEIEHAKGSCRSQKTKLKELKSAGATVLFCAGRDGVDEYGLNALPGSFHVKALVCDGAVAFIGSANFTRSAPKN